MLTSIEQITNFLPIYPWLATSGMPAASQFQAIARAGYQVVINLSVSTSPGQLHNEVELVESLGMVYTHIPVDWENPQAVDLQRFFEAVEAHPGQRIWVHCVMNYRVSAFVYLYRTLRMGTPPAEAWADLTRIWTPDGIWAAWMGSLADHGPTSLEA
jgi:protein tyrosine phosphatase (PTP) superfamily phosphohydrolase (DUF442 family)